ncbi:MAG: aspartyl protease family protein [Bacteroidota bacterium]
MKIPVIILLIALLPINSGQAQNPSGFHFKLYEDHQYTLPMEMSQNLMIIPVRINQSQTLRFVLDSGINNTIVTELTGADTLSLKFARQIKVTGLGDGTSVEAWFSEGNRLVIDRSDGSEGGIICESSEIYVLESNQFELSKQLGITVNGLIGSELFNQFVVKIDPEIKTITFFSRDHFNLQKKCRNYKRIPLILNGGKAYTDVILIQDDGTEVSTRLLIDTGASLSLWIAPQADTLIHMPAKTVKSLLGQGLNGEISGVNGRINEARLGPFVFKKPLVSYPDSASLGSISLNRERHGSIGNDLLRRFTVIMDYAGRSMYLKPNSNYNASFSYNRSGMEVEKPVRSLPMYTVYHVIAGSPADQAGVKAGDVIEYINYKPAFNLTLDDINNILHGEEGKIVTFRIYRDGQSLRIRYKLEEKI